MTDLREIIIATQRRDKNTKWYHWFYSKEYSHIFIYMLYDDFYIEINPLYHTDYIQAYNAPYNLYELLSGEGTRVSSIYSTIIDYNTHSSTHFLEFRTCVNTVKNILGIKKYFIITPKQLLKFFDKNSRYKKLL